MHGSGFAVDQSGFIFDEAIRVNGLRLKIASAHIHKM